MTTLLPPLTVAVIGRNEGERLARCLQSIREADYPQDKIDLIYVDSDSTDGSCTRAKQFGAIVISLKLEHISAAAARNAALRLAGHEIIHFFDGDTTIHRSWLKTAVRAIDDPNVACVFGRREETAPHASLYSFWAHHDWYMKPGLVEYCGGDALFRRDVLISINGFNEALIAGEEPELCFRIRNALGMTIIHVPETMTLHDITITRFRQYWNRCMRTGYAKACVVHLHPQLRSWRRASWREPSYIISFIFAAVFSFLLHSLIPIAAWIVMLFIAFTRQAVRLRSRFPSWLTACLYSAHLYIAKLPTTCGMCRYWMRRFLRCGTPDPMRYRS